MNNNEPVIHIEETEGMVAGIVAWIAAIGIPLACLIASAVVWFQYLH